MTEPRPEELLIDTANFPQEEVRALWSHLNTPETGDASYEIPLLQSHLETLRTTEIPPPHRTLLLNHIYTRGISAVNRTLPTLASADLPIHRKTRQRARQMQAFLWTLAEDLLLLSGMASGDSSPATSVLFWRALHLLSRHLLISGLISSPTGKGIWLQVNRSFELARRHGVEKSCPDESGKSIEDIYLATVLLGCAQPPSFTAGEIEFIASYIDLHIARIDAPFLDESNARASFWIDPERDDPACAYSRKAPPPETRVHSFVCTKTLSLLKKHILALETGISPGELGLPEFSGGAAGMGLMHRLIERWENPPKRRFPRRRQYYRASLCAGLEDSWTVLQNKDVQKIDTSSWMVTNESPEGYSVMHVTGSTERVCVGNLTAVRTDLADTWQICIVRWALSENQEHLELGLQILATNAIPAYLVQAPSEARIHALILPRIPLIRPVEKLVLPSGALEQLPSRFVLLVEQGNLVVRETRSTAIDEESGFVEIASVEPEQLSPPADLPEASPVRT